MMRVSEEQRGNAVVRSVEAKERAKQPLPVINWDERLGRFRQILDDVYRDSST